LDVFLGVIDHILEEDKQQIRKQRHTVKRIFERLKKNIVIRAATRLSKTTCANRACGRRRGTCRWCTRLAMRKSISEKPTIIRCGRVERAHLFVMDLPHSDDAFVMAFPAETTKAFLEGQTRHLLTSAR